MRFVLILLIAIFLMVCSRLDYAPLISYYDQSRVLQWGLFAGSTVFLLASFFSKNTIDGAFASSALIFFFLASGLVSASGAAFEFEALVEVARVASLFALAYSVAVVVSSRPEQMRGSLLTVLLVTVVLTVALCILVWVWMMANGIVNTQEIFWQYENRRFFGHFSTLAFPSLIGISLYLEGSKRGIVYALSLALMVFCIASGTRGSWLALAAAIAVTHFFLGSRAVPYSKQYCALIIASIAIYFVAFRFLPELLQITVDREDRLASVVDGSLSGRWELWRLAAERFIAHPWFGWGPMSFAETGARAGAHPHNVVLQLAAEWGGIALVVAFLILYLFAGTAIRGLKRAFSVGAPQRWLMLGLFVAILAGLAHAMVSGVFMVPLSETLFFLLAGWLYGECKVVSLVQAPSVSRRAWGYMRWSIAACLIAAISIQGTFIVSEFPHLSAKADAKMLAPDGLNVLSPRYWLAGRL